MNAAGASLAQDSQRGPDELCLHGNPAPAGNHEPLLDLPDVGSRLAQGSAADLERMTKGAKVLAGHEHAIQISLTTKDEPTAKRKRDGPLWEFPDEHSSSLSSNRLEKGHSRDLMPPPPPPDQSDVLMGRVVTPDLNNYPDGLVVRRLPKVTIGPGPATPQRQTSRTQNTNTSVHHGTELTHRLPMGLNEEMPRIRPDNRYLGTSVISSKETSGRRSDYHSSRASIPSSEVLTTRHQPIGTMRQMHLPAQFDGRSLNTEDCGGKAVTNASSSYHDGHLSAARPSFKALPHRLENAQYTAANLSPNRLTLPPRSSRQQRPGLLANVRTSHDQLGAAVSPHFGTQRHPYSSSLPDNSGQKFDDDFRYMNSFDRGAAPAAGIRYANSFDSGPTAVYGDMRPYSSTSPANNFLLAQDPTFEEARRRREEGLSTQTSFAERMQRAQADRGRTAAINARHRKASQGINGHGPSNVADPRASAPTSLSSRRPAQR